MKNQYDAKYAEKNYYWGRKPSPICFKILEMMPPVKSLKILVIGCGEGRNAIFLARNGYNVTAFDLSSVGVEKTKRMAEEAGVVIDIFRADVNEFRLTKEYDILFSIGTLHYIPEELRNGVFENYKKYTSENGLNVFSVLIQKPFIKKAPDSEKTDNKWISGELFGYYHDWKIEYCMEEVFDCISSGIPHKHASNRMIAKKISGML
ncbi:MAG: methyltransferase domain-containing protein [Candidatus Cloacimonetes bacterium]|nr:methyltransferase domain-containing protein [Candidatus Cloacimonadota bacterium]